MRTLVISFLLFTYQAMSQSVDTLDVGRPFEDFDKLQYGSFPFNAYSEKEGKKGPVISFTSVTEERSIVGKEVVAITHTWSGNNFEGEFLALVEKETFRPIIQIRKMNGKKEAYRFSSDKIIGLDTATNNAAVDSSIDLPFPVFNFEIDIETFAILPMREGAVFAVPFYHSGSKHTLPSYYEITVEGKEEVEIEGLGKRWCWVLFINYSGVQPTRFWYTQDRQFVKMEGEYKGLKIHKIREF